MMDRKAIKSIYLIYERIEMNTDGMSYVDVPLALVDWYGDALSTEHSLQEFS
jgi:hypothetical protein